MDDSRRFLRARNKLWLVKSIHTLVWAFFVAAIGYVVYSGLADRITALTGVAGGLVLAEGAVLLLFRGQCPLTLLARQYSSANRANFDIFLPEWLARHNQVIFTSIYGLSLLLLLYRLTH